MPRISYNTASEESFVSASRALKTCVESHERCKYNFNTKLPTRVLDLGHPDKPLSVKLYESSGLEAHYTCLSHCWGQTRSIKTERSNIASHYQGIVWTTLPRTFQDAIVFTRKLGLHYLWIDSLCIMQDEKFDWLKESANMSSIYKNSYLTISATKSANDDRGCFSRDMAPDQDYSLTAPEHPQQIYVREKLKHWNTIDHCHLPTTYPLLSRG